MWERNLPIFLLFIKRRGPLSFCIILSNQRWYDLFVWWTAGCHSSTLLRDDSLKIIDSRLLSNRKELIRGCFSLLRSPSSYLKMAHRQTNNQCKPLAKKMRWRKERSQRERKNNALQKGRRRRRRRNFSARKEAHQKKKKKKCHISVDDHCRPFVFSFLLFSPTLSPVVSYNDLVFFTRFYFTNQYDFHSHNLTINLCSPLISLMLCLYYWLPFHWLNYLINLI